MDLQSCSFISKAGRKIYYYTYGNPSAIPILFIHGFPGTGRQGLLLLQNSQYEKDFFLVSFDRPGYGDAEYEPNYTLKDFANATDELMNLLGIDKFIVLSVSGGGPYAASVSYFMGHRLFRTISINGIARMELKKFKFLNQAQKKIYLFSRLLPGPAKRFLAERLYNKRIGRLEEILVTDFNEFNPRDKKVLEDPITGPFLLETFKFSMQGGPYGLLSDIQIYLDPWGFEIRDIKVPYFLYHGDADDIVHPIWSQFMMKELTDVRFKLFEGEGHYSLPYNYRDHFLQDIISDLM